MENLELVKSAPAPKISVEETDLEALILKYRENSRKLSRSILRSWRVTLPLDEVYSVVDLALVEAANRFDPTKGASFMTFLYYHLRGNLVRAVTVSAKSGAMVALVNDDFGKEVDILESGFIQEVSEYSQTENECPDAMLLKKEREELCRAAYDKLDVLEREVLGRAFSNDESLVDIANALGYSRCHISRVKRRALQQLKTGYISLTDVEEANKPLKRKGKKRGRRRRELDSSVLKAA